MKAPRRARGRKKQIKRLPAGRRPGSWPTAVTEAASARRHVAQAVAALERLGPELSVLRGAAAATARLELARQLLAGADGGALGLLVRLADRDRTAAVVLERLASALGLEAVHAPNDRVTVTDSNRGDYEWLDDGRSRELGACVIIRPGWRLGDRVLARPVVASALRETV